MGGLIVKGLAWAAAIITVLVVVTPFPGLVPAAIAVYWLVWYQGMAVLEDQELKNMLATPIK